MRWLSGLYIPPYQLIIRLYKKLFNFFADRELYRLLHNSPFPEDKTLTFKRIRRSQVDDPDGLAFFNPARVNRKNSTIDLPYIEVVSENFDHLSISVKYFILKWCYWRFDLSRKYTCDIEVDEIALAQWFVLRRQFNFDIKELLLAHVRIVSLNKPNIDRAITFANKILPPKEGSSTEKKVY